MIRISINKVRDVVHQYRGLNIPYKYTTSLSSISVVSTMGDYTSNNNLFPPKELHFIKTVKESIIKNGLHLAAKEEATVEELSKKPVYFAYGKSIKPGDSFQKLYNIDINSAYWETANMMGLLSPEIYKRGKDTSQISKKTRLAAIGSLARKSKTYIFDGTNEILLHVKKEETEFIWNIICYKVGNVLTDVAKKIGDDFIFFWIDGIYVSNKATANRVQNLFSKAGYRSDITELKGATITKSHILIKSGKIKRKLMDGKWVQTDVKPFYYKNKKGFKI